MSTGDQRPDRPADDPDPTSPAEHSSAEEPPTEPGATERRTERAERTERGERTARGEDVGTRRPAEPVPEEPSGGGGKTAGLWISLILGAIVLVLLLIFVLQNNTTATFQYFSAQFELPLGIAMLLAAIAGALVMALVGSMRMIQMGWTIRKLRKQQDRIHRATR